MFKAVFRSSLKEGQSYWIENAQPERYTASNNVFYRDMSQDNVLVHISADTKVLIKVIYFKSISVGTQFTYGGVKYEKIREGRCITTGRIVNAFSLDNNTYHSFLYNEEIEIDEN